MNDFAGKVAVVTGAASGLGHAMALRFAAEGMRLAIADIDTDGLAETADELTARDVPVLSVPTDVSRREDVEQLAARAFDEFGAVHLLCNNAGVVKRARAWALTHDDWTWVLGVDLWSAIHGIAAFLPRMLRGGEPGHVVNTASMTGLLPMPGLAAYATAKSAVVGLSEALALDLREEAAPIGVSVFCPGFIRTRIADSDRNRPGTLPRSAPMAGTRTSQSVESTMTAAQAADILADAVRTGRFWVLTHPRYYDVLRKHAAAVADGGYPEPPPVW